ncbi:hypothetical protein CHS0354_002782 [Potamilus streckersoni]|uniref:Ubiquitin-like domain-containing protein n=1 Tax=Potamilus streckersoni TaxID=2493646 RepID=A0AAE0SNZ4_9BIVA|nr:hypothetical protein CHS0354_002782 [Potamilus streckersoni]
MATPVVDVYVKLPSGKATCIQLLPTDQVKKISEYLSKQEEVPERHVRLKYQGKVLNKSHAIGYLGICAETILKGEIIVPKDINVIAKLPDGRVEMVQVKTTDDVSEMKQKIGSKIKLSPSNFTVQLGTSAAELREGLLLDLGVTDECQIELKERSKSDTKFTDGTQDNVDGKEVNVDDPEKRQELFSTFNAAGRHVEVVFSFDTTGSMYSYLTKVRQKLRESCERLLRDIPNIRIGIIAHGDYCDYSKYVIRYVDLTSDVDTLVQFAENVPCTGGGDSPECYEWVLRKSQQLDWSEDSAKALIVIGDCEPHPLSYTDQRINWHMELDVLKGMGVKVYGVQAYQNQSSKEFYEELADHTGGYYLQLRNFDLITDMFLAVCYREADSEQLEAYVAEVEQEGRMTEDTKAFLDKLEIPRTDAVESEKGPKRYVRAPWWDPSLDTNKMHEYEYVQETDSWHPKQVICRESTITSYPVSTCTLIDSSAAPTRKSSKRSGIRRLFCFAS